MCFEKLSNLIGFTNILAPLHTVGPHPREVLFIIFMFVFIVH